MLRVVGLQVSIFSLVTGTADVIGGILGILFDLQRAMRGMTDQAILKRLTLDMGGMTVQATGDITMFARMTAVTTNLGVVLGGIIGKLGPFLLVADCTANNHFSAFDFDLLGQDGKRNLQRRMRILMAHHTFGK